MLYIIQGLYIRIVIFCSKMNMHKPHLSFIQNYDCLFQMLMLSADWIIFIFSSKLAFVGQTRGVGIAVHINYMRKDLLAIEVKSRTAVLLILKLKSLPQLNLSRFCLFRLESKSTIVRTARGAMTLIKERFVLSTSEYSCTVFFSPTELYTWI